MTILNHLLELDLQLYRWVHIYAQQDFLDVLAPILRNKMTWIPAYLALTIYWGWRYKTSGLLAMLGLVLALGLADLTSSQLVKKSVQRERPCRVVAEFRALVPCGGGYSFTSSHAANHAAMATFLWLLMGPIWGAWRWWLPCWALSIAWAQVYVGVHYPMDVIAGLLLGTILGLLTHKLYLRLPLRLRINTNKSKTKVSPPA